MSTIKMGVLKLTEKDKERAIKAIKRIMKENRMDRIFDVRTNRSAMAQVVKERGNTTPTTIFEYIKRGKKIVGLFIGWKVGTKVGVGYSLCNNKDKFRWDSAIELAYHRIFDLSDYYEKMPQSIMKQEEHFVKRCEKYFKAGVHVFHKNNKNCSYANYLENLPEDLKVKWNNEKEKERRLAERNRKIDQLRKAAEARKNRTRIPDHSCIGKTMFFTGISTSYQNAELTFYNRKEERPEGSYIEVTYKIFP